MKRYLKAILSLGIISYGFSMERPNPNEDFQKWVACKATSEAQNGLLFQGYKQFLDENAAPLMREYNLENLQKTGMYQRISKEGFLDKLTGAQKNECERFIIELRVASQKTIPDPLTHIYLEALYLLKAAAGLQYNPGEESFLKGISESQITGNFYNFFLNPENWNSILTFVSGGFAFDQHYENFPLISNITQDEIKSIQHAIEKKFPKNSYMLYGQDKVGIDLLLQGIFHNLNFISVPAETNKHIDGHGTKFSTLGFAIHDLLHKLVNPMPDALKYWIMKSYAELDEAAREKFKFESYFNRFEEIMGKFSTISDYYSKKNDFESAKKLQLGLFLALHEFQGSTSYFLEEVTVEKMLDRIFANSKQVFDRDFGFRKVIPVEYDLLVGKEDKIKALEVQVLAKLNEPIIKLQEEALKAHCPLINSGLSAAEKLEELLKIRPDLKQDIPAKWVSFELTPDFLIVQIKKSSLDTEPKIVSYPTADFQLKNSYDYVELLGLADMAKLNDEKFGIPDQRTTENYTSIYDHIEGAKKAILAQMDESQNMIHNLLTGDLKDLNTEYQKISF